MTNKNWTKFDFRQKFRFLTKISIFDKRFDKKVNLYQHRDQKGNQCHGEIIIRSEEILTCRDYFHFKIAFSALPKIGIMNPDPKTFLEIRRANESGEYVVVHRTEQRRSRNPEFSVQISGQKLCNGDLDRNLKFQLYRYRSSAMKSDFWGETDLTGNEIKTPFLGRSELFYKILRPKLFFTNNELHIILKHTCRKFEIYDL